MSPSLPVISGDQAVKVLRKQGFRFVRQTGSHMIMRRDQPFCQVTVPRHKEGPYPKSDSLRYPPKDYLSTCVL